MAFELSYLVCGMASMDGIEALETFEMEGSFFG